MGPIGTFLRFERWGKLTFGPKVFVILWSRDRLPFLSPFSTPPEDHEVVRWWGGNSEYGKNGDVVRWSGVGKVIESGKVAKFGESK